MSLIYKHHLILPLHNFKETAFLTDQSTTNSSVNIKSLKQKCKSTHRIENNSSTILNQSSLFNSPQLKIGNIEPILQSQTQRTNIIDNNFSSNKKSNGNISIISSIGLQNLSTSDLPPHQHKPSKSRESKQKLELVFIEKYLNFVNHQNARKIHGNKKFTESLQLVDKEQQKLFNQHYRSDFQLPTLGKNKNITKRSRGSEIQLKTQPNEFTNNSKCINIPIQKDDSFKNNKNLIAEINQKQIYAKRQHELQKAYDEENKNQIKVLKDVIKQLNQNLRIVFDYLNNQKKMFFVVRKLMGVRKNLYKILLNEEDECLIDPLNDKQILKRLQQKEQTFNQGEAFLIDCYNFQLLDDLIYLKDKCYEYNLMIKVQGVENLQKSILKENDDIQIKESKLEKQMQQRVGSQTMRGYKKLEDKDLLFLLNGMRVYQPLDTLSEIESKLGSMNFISKKSRVFSQALQEKITKMQQMYNNTDDYIHTQV